MGSQTGSKNNSNNNRKEDLIEWQGHNQSEIAKMGYLPLTEIQSIRQQAQENLQYHILGKNLRNLTLAKTKIS